MRDLTLPPLPPIQRTEVDGVTTFWMDEPGPLVAMLGFRVGRADEPSPMGGISHIIEHLALSGLGVQDYDHNGFVDDQLTVFTLQGRPDEVVAFMDAATTGLRALPVDRILLERRILRDEREQRGPSMGGALRWYRFGYAGQGRGLGPYDDELGLDWLGPEPVAAWARRWHTRHNAVLWLSGPLPTGLRLVLPDGEPAPIPSIEPIPGLRFPSHMPWDGPGVSLSYVATRSSALNIVSNIAHRRARQQLRFEQGLVYDVAFDYEVIDPNTAHVSFTADCPQERVPSVAAGLIEILRDLARAGPTTAELEQEMASYLRQYEERDGRIGLLAVTAFDHLRGARVNSPEDFLRERQLVDPAAAQKALADAMEDLLVLADAPAIPGLVSYPAWSPGPVVGREHGPAGFYLPGRKPKERLVIGDDGVTVTVSAGEWLTVRFDDLVACIHGEPQERTLLGRDGMRVTVHGPAWKDGARVIEAIDRRVPPELVACDEHGLGALADAPAAPADDPGRAPAVAT